MQNPSPDPIISFDPIDLPFTTSACLLDGSIHAFHSNDPYRSTYTKSLRKTNNWVKQTKRKILLIA